MAQTIVADDEKVYDVSFTFRGPKGCPYGAPIVLKMKCVLEATPSVDNIVIPVAPASDVDIYKLAIKLHEQLQLGDLETCIKVVRESNCDEAESIKALQRKN